MTKKFAVVMAGCGFLDGTEIHEAVMSLYFIEKAGATWTAFAPEVEFDEVDHLTQKPTGKKRNARTEAARIARGEIQNLADLNPANFDVLYFPGGYGAAKTLSDFAFKGAQGHALPAVQKAVEGFVAAGKPIGAICIAPGFMAQILGPKHVTVTIGTDKGTAAAVEATGAKHQVCQVNEISVDAKLKVVCAPAYMLGPGVKDIATGIEAAVKKLMSL